jgi:hypothetical protein
MSDAIPIKSLLMPAKKPKIKSNGAAFVSKKPKAEKEVAFCRIIL